MSGVLGTEDLHHKFDTFNLLMRQRIDDKLEDEAKAAQKEAAELVPVLQEPDTRKKNPRIPGQGRATILLPEAIKVDRSPDTGGKRVTFGFITKTMRDAAYYLFWVEFGTKGHATGEKRGPVKPASYWAGKRRRGPKPDPNKNIYKRNIPARPAQPFFRPAVANMMVRLRREREFKTIVDAVKAASGFADKQNSG